MDTLGASKSMGCALCTASCLHLLESGDVDGCGVNNGGTEGICETSCELTVLAENFWESGKTEAHVLVRVLQHADRRSPCDVCCVLDIS